MVTAAREVRAPAPPTAAGLLAVLAAFGPAVEAGALVFDRDPPPDLDARIRVLHTGLRALVSGRAWWGSAATGARPCVAELNPLELVPVWCGVLCVAGDTRWDRIHPAARLDVSALFATD